MQAIKVTAAEFLVIADDLRKKSNGSSIVLRNYTIIPDTKRKRTVSTPKTPADLRGCTFVGVDFGGVDTQSALLDGSIFNRCNLRHANFREVTGTFNVFYCDVTNTTFGCNRRYRMERSYYLNCHKPKGVKNSPSVDIVSLYPDAYELIKKVTDPTQFLYILQLADPKKSPEELIKDLYDINPGNYRPTHALKKLSEQVAQLTRQRQ